MRASMPSSMQTASGRSQLLSRLLESVNLQVQTRPVLTLPQSLHGAIHRVLLCGRPHGSSLPDIDGEAARAGERCFVVPAGQQHGNARKDCADSRTGRLHGDCLIKVDLTIDSHADSWILVVCYRLDWAKQTWKRWFWVCFVHNAKKFRIYKKIAENFVKHLTFS